MVLNEKLSLIFLIILGIAGCGSGDEGMESVGGEVIQYWDEFRDCSEDGTRFPGHFWIQSSEALAQFCELPCASHVEGSVYVDGFSNYDFSGLSCLEEIEKDLLLINFGTAHDLTGFDSLKRVGGTVFIDGSASLESLRGLKQLEEVGRDFVIRDNDKLINAYGIPSLKRIGGSLVFMDNKNLKSLDDFSQLEVIKRLRLENSPALERLGDFSALEEIRSDLHIENVPNLLNLDGLESLKVMGGSLKLVSNDALEDLYGLSGLEEIRGGIEIFESYALRDVIGLRNIRGKLQGLEVSACDDLNALYGLEGVEAVDGDIYINDNDSLSNFNGLNGLRYTYNMLITSNRGLRSTRGLSNLEWVADALEIYHNPFMTDIEGFESLVDIGHSCCGITDAFDVRGFYISDNTELVRIQAFDVLSDVGHLDFFDNVALSDFGYFPSLKSLSGSFRYGLNYRNYDLGAFGEIEEIRNHLIIEEDDFLESLAGLDSLNYLGGDLLIRDNDTLIRIKGLEALQTIDGSIRITNNASFYELDGLNNLSHLGGDLEVNGSAYFGRLNGLRSLEEITGSFRLEGLSEMTELYGLDALASVRGECRLSGLSNLESIATLAQLESVGGLFHLKGSPLLSEVSPLPWAFEGPGGVEVANFTDPEALNIFQGAESFGGKLSIEHCDFEGLGMLNEIQSIGGDLNFSNNRGISNEALWAWVDQVGEENIEGQISISNNQAE